MAEIIPPLNRQTLGRMTAGEKRLAKRLVTLLEDDYLVWYDIPLGNKRRYPDFIILHPSRGLLFLEVKDWKLETLQNINKTDVTLLTSNGLVTKAHPLEQARQYAYTVIDRLQKDPALVEKHGAHKGNLIMPYGWGVVLTNITRKQMQRAVPENDLEILFPDHLTLYKDEMTESTDPESFQKHLWDMFHYNFGTTLSLPQIDRIRWHLFPEIRINDDSQQALFGPDEGEEPAGNNLPDIIKIMDIQQEQLARSLGEGHRVIHGVSGSGKTLILGYRCLYLAKLMHKPILVLCFNITLAAKLRAFINERGIGGQVQVYHFHDWCGQQLKTYHVQLPESDKPVWEQQVEAVIDAVDRGEIPRAQYGALLIDEGHDFEADWLRLIVQMVDPESDSVLLLYDDAQSIYARGSQGRTLNFSLSSVGIKAQGRTTILRLNYRNTREILDFAYTFARQYIDPHAAEDDDHIPLVEPEAAGGHGPLPAVRRFKSLQEELAYLTKCLRHWQKQGIPLGDCAILYMNRYQGEAMSKKLDAENIPHNWLGSSARKKAYRPDKDRVTLVTVHSSKGLEFPRVLMMGVGQLKDEDENLQQGARLLYVGMTRAQERLLITTSSDNLLSKQLVQVSHELQANT
ncbi:MAG TPA: DNA helicase II [Gammaproteobacteria bacterium]|nr:DNA helicase II [Gammaproteobacteria bacterium]